MGCHGKTLTWEWLSWIIMGFVLFDFKRLLWWFQTCMFSSVLHADAIRCRCCNKSFQKLRWLADIFGERYSRRLLTICWQASWSVNVESRCAWLFGSFCSLVFQLDFSARLWIWPWSRIEELFDGCALPLLLFQRHVKAQHASAAALAEQQKQEMERQREQLSEACAVGAFSSCQGKEWRCLLHTSYQFKLIHFCWRSFLRLVIVHSVHPVEYVASWDLSVAST